MTEATVQTKTPWHLWAVGVISLLWNAYGGYDYVMTNTDNAEYLAAFTPEQAAYFDSFPTWMIAVWAVGVWGAVAGSILLLLRSRFAFPVFAVSLAAFVISLIYNVVLTGGLEIMGTMGMIMSGVIFVVCLALTLYARAMARKGVLR